MSKIAHMMRMAAAGGAGGASGGVTVTAAGSTGTTSSYPSDIQSGDLLVYVLWFSGSRGSGGSEPWTNLRNYYSVGNWGGYLAYKFADGTESGTFPTKYTGTNFTRSVVFRCTGPFSAAATVLSDQNAGDTETISLTSYSAPSVFFSIAANSTLGQEVTAGTSPTETGTVDLTELKVAYYVQDNDPVSDVTLANPNNTRINMIFIGGLT